MLHYLRCIVLDSILLREIALYMNLIQLMFSYVRALISPIFRY
jgi:hypothetical protein